MSTIRSLVATGILISSLFAGTETVGQGIKADILLNPQKQSSLGFKDIPEGISIQKDLKAEKQAKTEVKQPVKPKPYTELMVTATAYVSFCDTGCTGITATGTDVRNSIYHPSGLPIIAVDPAVIPLGSVVEIGGDKYIADDTGGTIKGHRIDILVDVTNTERAFRFGKQELEIRILSN